jgi:opacity protein-like surface antigen
VKIFAFAAVLVCLAPLCAAAADDKKDEPKASEWTGKLQTGVVAIGGETTGTVLQTKEGSFELSFGQDKGLRNSAEKFGGKQVTVTGKLNVRKGVEVKERRIITVTAIKEAGAKK